MLIKIDNIQKINFYNEELTYFEKEIYISAFPFENEKILQKTIKTIYF